MRADMKDKTRFFEIDLLRFIAAFAVLLFHYTFRGWAANSLSPVSFPTLGLGSRYGYLGVDLFFIISGFVILMSAWDTNLRGFVISRMARLYPAYWIACTLTAVVGITASMTRSQPSLGQYLANLSMLHSFIGIPDVDGVYWSLAIELKFYFLIALLLCVGLQRYYRAFLGLWLVFTVLIRLGYEIKYLDFFLFPEWSAYFIAGSAFYLLHRARLQNDTDWYAWLLVLVSYACAIHVSLGTIPKSERFFNTTFQPYVLVALLSLFFAVFAAIALGLTQFVRRPQFFVLGLLTYPLYLIHQNIGYVLFNYLHPILNDELVLFVVIGIMLSSAYALHTYGEKTGASVIRETVATLWDSATRRLGAGVDSNAQQHSGG